ncbi:MAG: cytochrome b/b6 domain-containing protein [Halopseudomonas sp.]|uniref:cytochrome b/b6 domain-containing protein n=1 Tax=Halopseudomonas sp. TaxID=2901191 RepID=UPI0030023C61
MQVVVWDLPLRLFHWLLALCVTGALVTVSLGGNWMVWHERFGLAVLGLLTFRLVWGLVGGTYARFSNFFPTPSRVSCYLRGQWYELGHNPLGAFSVFAMLALFSFQALTGLITNDDVAFYGPLTRLVSSEVGALVSGWHRSTEELIYVVIGLHILAIVIYRLRGKKLVGAMLHGRKESEQALKPDPHSGGALALSIALIIAIGMVWLAWGSWIPAPPPAPAVPAW